MTNTFDAAELGVLIRNPLGDQDLNAFGPTAKDVASAGFTRVDMLIQGPASRTSEVAEQIASTLDELGIATRRHLMATHEGEDYSSNAAACGNGLTDPATRQARLQEVHQAIEMAAAMGFQNVGLHAGTLHQGNVQEVAAVYRELCKRSEGKGLGFALETSAAPGPVVAALTAHVDHPALRLNFDPANYVAYGLGNPLDYLSWAAKAGFPADRIDVHAKDIDTSSFDPKDPWWGMPLVAPGNGCGLIDWQAIARWFLNAGNSAPWYIEHEPIGSPEDSAEDRKARQLPEIIAAREYLGTVFSAVA